jgi:osmotically-inducible protein OsmY
MKIEKLIPIIFIPLFTTLLVLSALGSTADNIKLYKHVIEKLKFEPRLDASEITISIEGNADIVILGGTVKTHAEKTIACKM